MVQLKLIFSNINNNYLQSIKKLVNHPTTKKDRKKIIEIESSFSHCYSNPLFSSKSMCILYLVSSAMKYHRTQTTATADDATSYSYRTIHIDYLGWVFSYSTTKAFIIIILLCSSCKLCWVESMLSYKFSLKLYALQNFLQNNNNNSLLSSPF